MAGSGGPIIEVNGLCKRYGKVEALLGAIFRSTGIVLGLGVVVAVGLFMVGIVDLAGLVDATPAGLISGLLDSVQAEPAPLAGPVLVSLLWILGLTGLAVARFQRRDL